MTKKIGGFFPLILSRKKSSNNFLKLWDINSKPHTMLSNGRSAINFLLKLKTPKNYWLPAYSCESLAEAVKGTSANLRFFPIKENLSPDVSFLKKNLKAGDVVLSIDYFGVQPDKNFLKFVSEHDDINFVEDRAQAILPAETPWGDYVLYSPRKLFGVPDGGILVSYKDKLLKPNKKLREDGAFIEPFLMRALDKTEKNNKIWYKKYVKYEESMMVSSKPISQITYNILKKEDYKIIIKKRRENFAILAKNLSDIAVIDENIKNFVPFGFPIKVRNIKKAKGFLFSNSIYAAHHWPVLPSPKKFKFEHEFSSKIITLPCDHRYSIDDMVRIVGLIKKSKGEI